MCYVENFEYRFVEILSTNHHVKWVFSDLNWRPSGYEPDALTNWAKDPWGGAFTKDLDRPLRINRKLVTPNTKSALY